MRIARGDGRRLCLALTRAERALDRPVGLFVVTVFADGLADAEWAAEAADFFGADGESLCAAMVETRNSAVNTPAKIRVPVAARVEDVGDFIDSLYAETHLSNSPEPSAGPSEVTSYK